MQIRISISIFVQRKCITVLLMPSAKSRDEIYDCVMFNCYAEEQFANFQGCSYWMHLRHFFWMIVCFVVSHDAYNYFDVCKKLCLEVRSRKWLKTCFSVIFICFEVVWIWLNIFFLILKCFRNTVRTCQNIFLIRRMYWESISN